MSLHSRAVDTTSVGTTSWKTVKEGAVDVLKACIPDPYVGTIGGAAVLFSGGPSK